MAWLRHIGGRLESRLRYSVGIVYNPFPWPQTDERQQTRISVLAQGILDARTGHAGQRFSDLYDPDLMPRDLRAAHRILDAAVDRLYRPQAFTTDRERVEHLFTRYERLVAPLTPAFPPRRRGRRLG